MNLGKKSAAPGGMASMLKMFGIDPAEIIESGRKFGAVAKEMADRLERLESKIDRIAQKLGIEEEKNGEQLSIVASGTGTGKIRG